MAILKKSQQHPPAFEPMLLAWLLRLFTQHLTPLTPPSHCTSLMSEKLKTDLVLDMTIKLSLPGSSGSPYLTFNCSFKLYPLGGGTINTSLKISSVHNSQTEAETTSCDYNGDPRGHSAPYIVTYLSYHLSVFQGCNLGYENNVHSGQVAPIG